jgi:subtilisin family serine protease
MLPRSNPRCALGGALIAATSTLFATVPCAASPTPAPLPPAVAAGPAAVDQAIDESTGLPSYLVQLRASSRTTGPAAAAKLLDQVLAETIGAARVRFRYEHALVGFAAPMSPAEADRLRAHPLVARVEADLVGRVATMPEATPTDPNAPNPWALRRISQADGLAPAFNPCGANGSGVTLVVIDSGINPDHAEFAGRVRRLENFYTGAGADGGRDIYGHGTHVAGCAAGATTGPAPGADIVSLAVSNTNGDYASSALAAALNWVLMPGNVQLPAVINISLSGQQRGASASVLEEAISSVMLHGIPVVVAAGNDSWPSSWMFPASSAFALTVGAADIDDHPAIFSNYGPEVGIWAPGTGILAADWRDAPNGLKLMKGTSMASPVVAGVAALYLQRHPPTAAERALPATIATRTYLALMASAARGRLTDVADPTRAAPGGNGTLGGAANRLLQACERTAPASCTDDEPWIGSSKSIILGDGITPIDASFRCVRNVRNPAGPVSVTINTVSLGISIQGGALSAAARVRILDATTGSVLWNSDAALTSEAWDVMAARTVRASGAAGVYIEWQPVATSGDVGFGYAMTATLGGGRSGFGDVDGDGVVDAVDLGILLALWGPCGAAPDPCIPDLDGNGAVDAIDLGALLAVWGPCAPSLPPAYVADCSGNPVLRSYLGDNFRDGPGTLPRPMRPDPIHAPNVVYPANLDCEALGWDAEEGNRNSVSFDDPRTGAGSLDDGFCGQATLAQCFAGNAFFWGRGLGCNEVPGLAPLATLAGCAKGEIGTGFPVTDVQPASLDPTTTVLRQVVPQGVTSITELRVVARPGNIAGSSSVRVPGWTHVPSMSRPLPTTEFPVRVTVRFRDGGAPLVVDRIAVTQPYGPAGVQAGVPEPTRLVTIAGILPSSAREVLSVAVQAMPEGLDCISSMRTMPWGGRPMAEDESGAGAEVSKDGGAHWSPVLTAEGARFQAAMCIVR